NKPTPVGYKILALCDAGFMYTILPESRVSSTQPDPAPALANDERLSLTGQKVMHLVEKLPYRRHVFNV
ncbi:hypothetical protein BGZ74_004058, partial [Mortierella antarctica]